MRSRFAWRYATAPIIAVVLVALSQFTSPPPRSEAARSLSAAPIGRVEIVQRRYSEWLARHESNGGDHNVAIGLGWSKGLSSELSSAVGLARLDLITGNATIEIAGLDVSTAFDVWIVDNRSGPGRTVRPEDGDELLWVGTLEPDGAARTLEVDLAGMSNIEVDLVVVTRHGESPIESGMLFGAPALFQRIYTGVRSGRITAPSRPTTAAETLPAVPPALDAAHACLETLVEEGSELFFEETFDGNGRTCGTCHPAEHNLTIDPTFIASLPADDPLFVAEFVPELAVNFEKPELMRGVGLILENLDGFDDLENRFTMRGVPHTLALGTSLTPAPPGADGTTTPPDERTGWSGDGAPGSGTLREFAIGAVRQHFTRSLGRVPDVDFRFPTDEELDAMEAFQLSLGRDADPDLETLVPRSEVARRGLEIFLASDTEEGTVAAGKCNLCHQNAGATVSLVPGGFNFNFDTGIEQLADTPADLIDAENNPPDGGFGLVPDPDRPGAFGDGTFNTPSLVEAADTGPFFHDNAVETIEEAVGFYNSQAFADSPAGQFLAGNDTGGIGIQLEATQVVAIAALLRVLNALENLRSAEVAATRALTEKKLARARPSLALAIEELRDAVTVLRCGGLHPEAVGSIEEAIEKLSRAAKTHRRHSRANRIESAIERMEEARGGLIE